MESNQVIGFNMVEVTKYGNSLIVKYESVRWSDGNSFSITFSFRYLEWQNLLKLENVGHKMLNLGDSPEKLSMSLQVFATFATGFSHMNDKNT